MGALGSAERLDHRDALHELDDGTRDPSHGPVELLLLAQSGRGHHQRDQRHCQHHRYQRDQREPPVDGEQVDQRHQRHHERGDELAGGVGDERVHGTHVLPHHLCQLAGPAPGEPADRHAPQPRGQLPAERQLHLAVENVPDSGRRGREQQPDEQAGRTRDHDEPDMTVIDRAGRQQSTTQFDDRQQRRQTRDSADDLQDHNGCESSEIRAQQPYQALFGRGIGIRSWWWWICSLASARSVAVIALPFSSSSSQAASGRAERRGSRGVRVGRPEPGPAC